MLVLDEEQSQREVRRLYQRLLTGPCDQLRVACEQGLNLTAPASVARIEREIEVYRPAMVIIDSVQQMFAGADGNDAAAVAAVFNTLFRLRRICNTAFLLIGHLKKPPPEGHIAKLHLIHGSVAFGTQASTVWVATSPTTGLLDLTQVKRRDGEKTSLRVRYATEGQDAPIVLTGEGQVEDQETVAEHAQDFVVAYLGQHQTSPTAWIVEAAAQEKPNIGERAVNRALKHLVGLGTVERPRRGYYALANRTEAP